jgi:predicted HicB family RNase H-like nuclease
MWEQGKGLNVRPFPVELREDLRTLAADAGQSLYLYVVETLRQHVQERRRSAHVGASV